MPKIIMFKEVKDFIENNTDCKLLSTEYKNSDTKLIIKCKCGDIFEADYSSFKYKNKKQCNKCSLIEKNNKSKLSYDSVKTVIESKNCNLLSKEYIDAKTKLKIQCECGEIFYQTIEYFKYGRDKCKKCLHKKHIDINLILNNIEKKGYILLNEYVSSTQKLLLIDGFGYKYSTSYNNLMSGKVPSKFHVCNQFSIENIKLWLKLNNKPLQLLSERYEGNDKNLKWKCLKEDCGETFKSTWGEIQQNRSCPFCCILAIKNPDLASEWHPTKNGNLTPYDITCGSGKKVWWKCHKEHEWSATVRDRNNDKGCPFCSGRYPTPDNNLLISKPELCKDWDYYKNIRKPEDYTPKSNVSVWWKCSQCGFEWKAIINNRNRLNRGCPQCKGGILKTDDEFKNEVYSLTNDYEVVSNYINSHTTIKLKHNICNKIFDILPSVFLNKLQCPHCNLPKGEKKIMEILENNFIIFIPQKTFNGLVGINNGLLSYDFYLPNYNLLIEYDGEFHDGTARQQTDIDLEKQQEHDRRKREYAKENNIKLLEIWYWDYDNIEEILKKELNKYYKSN